VCEGVHFTSWWGGGSRLEGSSRGVCVSEDCQKDVFLTLPEIQSPRIAWDPQW
jgi:hypothetical protein